MKIYLTKLIACLLLVLMPLQVMAASLAPACMSMMQAAAEEYTSTQMPCHEMMDNAFNTTHKQNQSNKDDSCKSYCAAMCASLNVVSIISSTSIASHYLTSSSVISMPIQAYAYIIQSNLLRPPIFLS